HGPLPSWKATQTSDCSREVRCGQSEKSSRTSAPAKEPTITVTVAVLSAAPFATAWTTSVYEPAGSAATVDRPSVRLSEAAVGVIVAVSPAGAPVVAYVAAVENPELRVVLMYA